MPRYLPLICLALSHTLVDACAFLVEPLWGELRDRFHFSEMVLFGVLSVQAFSPSFSQAAFGYLRDRTSTRWLLWLGPVTAAVCLSLVGVAGNVALLCLLLLVGGIGIGAFHPEAAVAAGSLLPQQRTRALSVFMFGGALGLGLGPIIAGSVVGRFGLSGLAFLGPAFVLLIALLYRGGRQAGSLHEEPDHEPPRRLSEMLEGRGRLALAVLALSSLRLVPNMAMNKVLAFTLQDAGQGTLAIGLVQALFLGSASVGMLWMAFRFRAGHEKAFLVACPLLGIPLMAAMGWQGCPQWLLLALLVPAGLILWGTTPAMVSYAHQQFPRGAGVASAITMGVAWGFGGMIQARITSAFVAAGIPQQAFLAFIPCLIVAAVGCCFLPAVPAASSEEAPAEQPEYTAEFAAEPADAR